MLKSMHQSCDQLKTITKTFIPCRFKDECRNNLYNMCQSEPISADSIYISKTAIEGAATTSIALSMLLAACQWWLPGMMPGMPSSQPSS